MVAIPRSVAVLFFRRPQDKSAQSRSGNFSRLKRARKSPPLSVLGGQNGRLHGVVSDRIRTAFSTIPFTDISFSRRKSH